MGDENSGFNAHASVGDAQGGDMSLSNSLLNMSLDKDMLIDDLSLSGTHAKEVLSKPLADGALEALASSADDDTAGDGKATSANRQRLLPRMSPTATMLRQVSSSYKEG